MSGQSIGSILGGIIGVALSPFTGGASLLVTSALMAAGGMIGGLLDPPKAQQSQGPRLNDLSQQTATYGAFLPRIKGKIAVFGNVFWIENNKLKEVALTTTTGGKGAPPSFSQTTYKYYATFAVGLAEGLDPALFGTGAEVVLSKVWISGKLFYNRTSTDDETVLTSLDLETRFKFFSGTEDQLPDTRMEADLGVANCPAYRGRAYLVIYDLDVAAYGNSLAGVQVKAELTTNVTRTTILQKKELATVGNLPDGICVDSKFLYVVGQTSLDIFDLSKAPSLSRMSTTALPTQYGKGIVVRGDYAYIITAASAQTGHWLRVYNISNPTNVSLVGSVTFNDGSSFSCILLKDNYIYVDCTNSTSGIVHGLSVFDISNPSNPSLVTSFITPRNVTWMTIGNNYIYLGTTTLTLDIIDISNPLSPSLAASVLINAIGVDNLTWVLVDGNYLYIVGASFRIYDLSSTPLNPILIGQFFFENSLTENGSHRHIVISDNYAMIPNFTNGSIEVYDVSDKTNPVVKANVNVNTSGGTDRVAFANHTIFTLDRNASNQLNSLLFYEQITPNTISLGDIVKQQCLQSKLLTAADLNVSLLTQQVKGYRVSSVGSIRSGIEPLQGAWPFDVIQDGYKIKYVPRGGTNVATIGYDKLDSRLQGDNPGIQLTSSREMDTILPTKVTIKYLDVNREYDTGEQYYERINTDAVNLLDLDLPIVLNGLEAAGKAQTLTFLYWLERFDLSFKLPPEYNNLQPSDIITITAPDATYNLRLKQINYTADGRLECTAKLNRPSIYSPTEVGQDGVPPDEGLVRPGRTLIEFLDIPLLQPTYDRAGFPVAMTGEKTSWPGGVLYRSDDAGQSYIAGRGLAPPGSTMGVATNTLTSHTGGMIDKASILNITMLQGELASITESQMLSGINFFAYGKDGRWEIIAAQLAVLQGDGSYNLSNILRGRFGTEKYTGTHVVGDKCILLKSSTIRWIPAKTAWVGASKIFKAVNLGSTLDTAIPYTFVYNAVNLKPLAPVYLNGNRNNPATNDWTLDWIRRSRLGTQFFPILTTFLDETTESYDIEIYSSNTFVTLKRTLTSITPTVVYTSANQVADFGSNQATLNVRIYQNSSVVGRGVPLQTSITR